MPWHYLVIGGPSKTRLQNVESVVSTCNNDFPSLPPAQQADAALYEHYDVNQNVSELYFSPGAATVAIKLGAKQCPKPSKKLFAPKSGNPALLKAHFP